MMLISCFAAPSDIEGIGVFARTDVASGTKVYVFDMDFDVVVTTARLAAAPKAVQELFRKYGFGVPGQPDQIAIDGDDGRFMNHSGRPNLDFSRQVVAYAIRDIEAGEELTMDYRWSAPEGWSPPPHWSRLER